MNKKKPGLRKEDREVILNVLKKFAGIEEAMIFGSRAMGNFKHGSDIDLALKGKVADIYLRVKSILNQETLLPYNFDVLDYENISNQKLKAHIDNYGETIYKKTAL